MPYALLLFFIALGIGAPVAFALGFAGAAYILVSGQVSIATLPTIMFGAMDSFPLLAIPLFIMAGDLMGRSGMLERLIDFAKSLVGSLRGGLAHVTVLSSMGFGAVSGVSLADAAAVGRTLIPGLVEAGYPRGFAAAVTAASCVMGAIIPPSVGMLIIAYIFGGRLSVGHLFLSGIIPGVMVGLSQMATVALMARRRNLPAGIAPLSGYEVLRTFRRAVIGLGMPVLVIGGIKVGYFTPTEAGAAAVAYALFFGMIGGLRLTWNDVAGSLLLSAKMSGMIFILLATSQVFSWLLILNQIPQQIAPLLQPVIGSPEVFLITILVAFILLGTFLEGVPTMIMLIPVVAPIAPTFGVDDHHLALVILMATQFAILSPPVALALFIVCPIAGCTSAEAMREVWPFAGCILLVTLAVIFFPQLASFIPKLAGY